MKLRLCYCYIICHSVMDDINGLVCDKTTGHQWIPVPRDHWSGALVVQYAAIPSPVVSHTKGRLDVFFHVCLTELFKQKVKLPVS